MSQLSPIRFAIVNLAITTMLVLLGYEFVDRPVARSIHDHHTSKIHGLEWLTEPPPILQMWSPAILALLALRAAFGRLSQFEIALAAACIAMIVADQFRESLSAVFGRTWPETWTHNNPSYIQDGVFGFHWLHGGEAFASFPSGHTARMAAFCGVFAFAFPRSGPACLAAVLATMIGLVGMNYHFVSDTLAGAGVGAIVARWAAAITHRCIQTPIPEGAA